MKSLITALAVSLFSFAVTAQVVDDSIIYAKSAITITHQLDGIEKLADTDKVKESEGKPVKKPIVKPRTTTFNVEVRTDKSLYLRDMMISPQLDEENGFMIVYEVPEKQPYLPENMIPPVDVLYIDSQGNIVQIIPDANLRTLKKLPTSPQKAIAVLMLEAGMSVKKNILPGDVAEHDLFTVPPVILN